MLSNYRYRGRHRAPATTGQTCAKVAAAGVVGALPVVAVPAAHAAPDHVWDKLAQCESSGNWAINTGNGYFGGVQFHPQTWRGFGGAEFAPMAHQATRAEQVVVAERVLAKQGWGAWPACSRKLGIRGYGVDLRDAPAQESAPQSAPVRGAPARSAAGHTHAVKRGETLSRIARDHGSTWQKVHATNRAVIGADPDRIFPGQRLVIP
jgi:LysM repeat protein